MNRGASLRRALLVGAIASRSLVSSAPAGAEDLPCAPRGPWVLLAAPPRNMTSIDVSEVFARLGVELTSRGIALCASAPASPREPALATITLLAAPPAPGSVTLDVEVRDEVTSKRVARTIDLASTPPDGRALTIALVADELLRASWAELKLAHAPPPVRPLSPASFEAVDRATVAAEPPPAHLFLGARAAAEWWGGGLALYGGDGAAELRVAPRFDLDLSAGARASPSASVAGGSISASAFVARLGASLMLVASREVALAWGARSGLELVSFAAVPAEGRRATPASSVAFVIETGPRLSLGTESARLVLDASLAGAPRGVWARAAGERAIGLAGAGANLSVAFIAGVL